ncbi:hypothetical protein AKJ16_DCAP13794 [Drosera capensis]
MAATMKTETRIGTRERVEDDPNVAISLSDTVFWFLDQLGAEASPSNMRDDRSVEGDGVSKVLDWEEEEEEGDGDELARVEENKETLSKTSAVEKRIREATRQGLKDAQKEGNVCVCRRKVAGTCRSCLMREIAIRLRNSGYNCALCKTKWKSSPDMPSGEHTFLDVIDDNVSQQKKEIRVIIELSFRAEFEMGWENYEYKRLVSRLPEAFVGKAEKLKALIKILCSAAKKSMESNKMHMGPWRKQNYMQAKWFSLCDRTETLSRLTEQDSTEQPIRGTRASNSMLTVALLDILPNMPYKALMVV